MLLLLLHWREGLLLWLMLLLLLVEGCKLPWLLLLLRALWRHSQSRCCCTCWQLLLLTCRLASGQARRQGPKCS